ncbi:MAG: glycosyltransferase [Candidatus Micrarchaeia archaeon]|jgi:glycosyltransferase involved in cell wall biosynthesis
MAKKRVDISVIVPAYNEEKYIGACLAAIKRQRFTGTYEIVVGDGHSTDHTGRIARDYGARVVEEKFGTPSGGRYIAAKGARGRIFAFTSSDVQPCQDWLQSICDAFEDKDVAWVVGGVRPFEGNLLEYAGAGILNFLAATLNRVGLAYVNGDNVAARADAYRKCGGFNPRLMTSEDTDLGMKLMHCGKFRYAWRASVFISMRRVRKWGYLNFALFHTGNFVSTHFLRRPASMYAPIR